MSTNYFFMRLMLPLTASPGHSLGMLSDGGTLFGRRAMHSLVPAGSYDDDLPEPPLPSESPLRGPIDVPPPPEEPPFPRAPQPTTPPERKPEAWLDAWLAECRARRTRGQCDPQKLGGDSEEPQQF